MAAFTKFAPAMSRTHRLLSAPCEGDGSVDVVRLKLPVT